MFIDRKTELELLGQRYRSNQAELLYYTVAGVSEKRNCCMHFCADKPHIFFIATLSSDSEQLATFSQQVYGFTHADALRIYPFLGSSIAGARRTPRTTQTDHCFG